MQFIGIKLQEDYFLIVRKVFNKFQLKIIKKKLYKINFQIINIMIVLKKKQVEKALHVKINTDDKIINKIKKFRNISNSRKIDLNFLKKEK